MDSYSDMLFSLTQEAIKNYETKEANNEGKLAYLSLTSKPEGPIRDRVAWLLQKKFDEEGGNLFSSREYKRYDLAILKPNDHPNRKEPEVKHIYEFKVGSAASFRGKLKQADKFDNRVVSDFQIGFENNDLEKMTCIFIGVEPKQKIKKNEYAFVKYAGRTNSLRKKINQEGLDETFINKKLVEKFDERDGLELIESDSIELKAYNDKSVCLHLLILKPIQNHFSVN
ncbi:hypothetical protein [Gracilimonas sp.]|uniref:hypothetical protein n=1 Tax=Gracilimonas sp. TaxID=1974203 RepID=UPI00287110A4|nr:hypothetical protein [Gracilimonas sp.]